jgi:general secretion pathway protein G
MMKKGFTLIEILVAATIIAVLVSIGLVSYSSVNRRSRDAKRKSDLEQVRSALEMYRADMGYYSDAGTGNWTNVSDLAVDIVDTYMPFLPSDPADNVVYRYLATNPSGTPTQYYGYCVSALLESGDATDGCTPDTASGHNYGVKNP